jgi:hypothetical protein
MRLNLTAQTPSELLAKLAATDITVPFRTEGRTASHGEAYMAARLLASLAETVEITYPLKLIHREKPDFALEMDGKTIGVECTEAVSKEWAQIDAIRERDFPESLIMLPMLKPGIKKFSLQERIAIAKGEFAGTPWVGGMAKRQWAEAQAYFIGEKTKKLRAGNYSDHAEVWLAVQDEWRVPMYGQEHTQTAAQMCLELLRPMLATPSFTRIYVSNSNWLVRLHPGPVEVRPICRLWN